MSPTPLLLLEASAPDAPVLHLQVRAAPADGPVLAEARLAPAIGLAVPRFWFHVGCTVHASASLGLFQRQRTLLLGNDHTGASELSLHGAGGDPAALQLALHGALLLLAQRRARFAPRLLAELPGPRDAAGHSPFWQGLVRHFHDGAPDEARQRLGEHWRAGVAALLPRQPVYTAFLAAEVQAAIAQVPPEALPLRELLEHAGLRYGHHVCIDDGGPVLEAETDTLPIVAASRQWRLAAPDETAATGSAHWLLAAAHEQPARATRAPLRLQGDRVVLSPATARLLQLEEGDPVRVWPVQAS
jgi:arginine N-succinyltransferase